MQRDRRVEQLCKKSTEELFGEHACMAYDRDLMMRTAVKHHIFVDEDAVGPKPNMRDFVRDAIAEKDQVRFLAGYIDQFEKAEMIHSEFGKMISKAKSAKNAREQFVTV